MNYEEKYRQAFERAKERYSACSAPALLEYIFPELKESEEENVRKVLVGYFKSYKEIGTIGAETFNGIPTDNIIAWLEKQGEQPTDKVEPKFKVGDWVVNTVGDTNQVVKVWEDGYTLDNDTFLSNSWATEHYHRWTIQDAEDGHVLVSNGKRGQEVGIVKKFIGKYGGYDKCFETYCYSDLDGTFRIGEYMGGTSIHPATKEQRDLLFQKMADAGYKWDAGKKELWHKL